MHNAQGQHLLMNVSSWTWSNGELVMMVNLSHQHELSMHWNMGLVQQCRHLNHTYFLPSFLPTCLTQRPSNLNNTTWLESTNIYKVQNILNTMKIYNLTNTPLGGGHLM
jgi:hypothetical protein